MKRATGIGGIFFKSADPAKLKIWYKENLGIDGLFLWQDMETKSPCYTVWNNFPESSAIFQHTGKEYIINYCVEGLESLLIDLKNEGVLVCDKIEKDENGKFGYALDPEGNKAILWESSGREPAASPSGKDRVTGLGGVFFKSPDPKKLNEWYAAHLGIAITEWGSSFQWIDPANAKAPATTAWSIFKSDTNYFNPSKKQFMFNYRVKDLVGLLEKLKSREIEIAGKVEEFSYGKFGWIVDPEGNKIELWEPLDDSF